MLKLQDKGVEQSCHDEVRNPSNKDTQIQVEKAASAWKEMEFDEGLLSVTRSHDSDGQSKFQLQQANTFIGGGPGGGGRGGGRSNKTSSKKTDTPLVAAARCRARTTKEFLDVTRQLEKAQDCATTLLDVIAPKLLGDELAQSDPSLALVRSRLDLVLLATDTSIGTQGNATSVQLFEKALEDPFLREMQQSLLSSPDAVQTIGMVKFCRDVKLDLYLAIAIV